MKRPRCLQSQLYLVATVLLVTILFIISQQYHLRNLQAVQGELGPEQTTRASRSSEQHFLNKVNAVARLARFINATKHGPFIDYVKYPCVKGVLAFPKKQWAEIGKCVRTINDTDLNIENRKNCVPLQTFKGSTIICTHPIEKDTFVSASVQRDGQWEGTLVFNIARLLQSKPDAEFLDIGCNIGTYTLAMAHQGTKVTAVDPLLTNLELLSKSLKLGHLRENVTLIWNVVSNEHALVALDSPYGNVGGTNIQDISHLSESNTASHFARTITLDDLVPLFKGKRLVIKMDIEGSEYNALLGGNLFFESVDIILVQLEFMMHKVGADGQNIANFLESKGLEPYLDLGKSMPLKSSDVSKWSNDVYFLKP